MIVALTRLRPAFGPRVNVSCAIPSLLLLLTAVSSVPACSTVQVTGWLGEPAPNVSVTATTTGTGRVLPTGATTLSAVTMRML